MKSFLKWPGGKGKLAGTQIEVPQHIVWGQPYHYCEPFVGGGSMFFYLATNHPNMLSATLSDVNAKLIGTYLAVRDDIDRLLRELTVMQKTYLSGNADFQRYMYGELRDEYNRAFAPELFIFLNKTAFNGLYRENSSGGMNVPTANYKNPLICDTPTLLACHKALQKATILNCTYDKIVPENGSYVYMDPPYRTLPGKNSFVTYSSGGFSEADHIALRDYAKWLDTKDCHVQISNSYDGGIYEGFDVKEIRVMRSISGSAESRGNVTEIVASNRKSSNFVTQ